MKTDPLVKEVLATWKRHQQILIFLLDRVPKKHLGDVAFLPGAGGVGGRAKGRDVARQFAHLERVRRGWLHYHATGKRPELPKTPRGEVPDKAQLKAALRESGKAVEELLGRALRGEARIRMFGRSPVRWMGYLIAHESHHRGQILLALKQSGHAPGEKVAVQGLWGRWMFGK